MEVVFVNVLWQWAEDGALRYANVRLKVWREMSSIPNTLLSLSEKASDQSSCVAIDFKIKKLV